MIGTPEKAERDLEKRTRRKDKKRKAGTKRGSGVSHVGKEERGSERERKTRPIFVHPVSSN